MSDLFHPNLITTKLIIVTTIEAIIFLFIFWMKVAYKEKIKIIVPLNFKYSLFSVSIAILFYLILVLINFVVYQYSAFTLLIFTAVVISILYIEMGIVLSRNFLVKFFDNELPKKLFILLDLF